MIAAPAPELIGALNARSVLLGGGETVQVWLRMPMNKEARPHWATPSMRAGRKSLPLPQNDPECIPALVLSSSR